MPRRLTNEFMKTVHPPATGALTIWDADPAVKGFGLRVYASGSKSFFLNYRVDGRERRFTIGDFPTWSTDAARDEAKRLRRLVDQGHDPAQEKRERREAPTVQDLIKRYEAEHLPAKRAKARKLDYQAKIVQARDRDEKRMLAEIADHLGKHRKVAEIHDGDITAMHRTITASGRPVRANRILAIASKLFALSLRSMAGENRPWRDAAQGNPCKGVERNHEEPRERFFSQAELAAIGDALAEYGRAARGAGLASARAAADCVRLVMLTGCRPSEAMLATWDQFEAEAGFWVKPSAHVKRGKTDKVPLNPAALELIGRLSKGRERGATWVFPGQRPGEPLRQLWHVWHYVRDAAKLGDDARLYDLRHTFASVGAGGGLSLPIIGRLLGHTQARTTQRYAHLADDPVREATEKIGKIIVGAGQIGAKVVPMKG